MTDTLREAAEYILDGMGIDGPDYTVDPDDEYLDAANSKWVKETLSRLAAALAAAPQPAPVDRDACRAKQAEPDRGFDETPYDRGYVWGYRHGLRDGKAEVAPQPAPERTLLAKIVQDAMIRTGVRWDSRSSDAIADALLARGLRLPGPETMAWGVVDKHGNLDPHTIYPDEWMADRKVDPGERLVRVAIRVVEGGDDE